jgi:malate dehydrogenase (oxaloacetate-decarboxylating)(NADP+)
VKLPIPDEVKKVYPERDFSNRREYVIPTPFDPRLLEVLSVAVAKAAIESGVAKHKISNWDEYKK